MSNYSGFIAADPDGGIVEEKEIEVGQRNSANPLSFMLKGTDFGLKAWNHFTLHSPQPLADETWNPEGFDYRVYVVIGRARLIVLAPRRSIAEYVWNRVFQQHTSRVFRRVNIMVPALVSFCADSGSEFLITSLFGDYSGPTTLLKRISFYGDEVTKSPLFETYHGQFNFYRAGLGRRLFEGIPSPKPNEEGEIVQLGSTGNISMELRNHKDASELIAVINFVMEHRWVEDWVPE